MTLDVTEANMGTAENFRGREFTIEFLRENEGRAFTARQLAIELIARHPYEAEKKRTSSAQQLDQQGLVNQVSAEIGAFRKDLENKYPNFRATSDRPRLYSWGPPESDVAEDQPTEVSLSEQEMYPLLATYLRSEKSILPMRIDEKKSSSNRGTGGNRWLHPDVVGIENLAESWHDSTRSLSQHYRQSLVKLWSFEVKKRLTTATVRSAFFQTVSNSTWANFSYLVAAEIDEAAKEELEVLSPAHRIGVIKLDVENPMESQVVLAAEERPNVDWKMIDRLASENSDFRDFLLALSTLHQTGDSNIVEAMTQKSF